jgi:hypothetical protein
MLLTQKLQEQGYIAPKLKIIAMQILRWSARTGYELSSPQMAMDLLPLT